MDDSISNHEFGDYQPDDACPSPTPPQSIPDADASSLASRNEFAVENQAEIDAEDAPALRRRVRRLQAQLGSRTNQRDAARRELSDRDDFMLEIYERLLEHREWCRKFSNRNGADALSHVLDRFDKSYDDARVVLKAIGYDPDADAGNPTDAEFRMSVLD